MTSVEIPLQPRSFGETMRRDAWWLQPLLTFAGLFAFIIYSTWAALQNAHYHWGPYLSPFYSPELFGDSAHSWLGPKPEWWPSWLLFSPAFLILWAPGGFRLTCYYYRGAYYKAFWADPPSCTVGEPRKTYRGESSFPLILSTMPIRHAAYNCVSCLNRRHMLYAWMSLFWVGFSGIYIRLCSMGVWTDWRII